MEYERRVSSDQSYIQRGFNTVMYIGAAAGLCAVVYEGGVGHPAAKVSDTTISYEITTGAQHALDAQTTAEGGYAVQFLGRAENFEVAQSVGGSGLRGLFSRETKKYWPGQDCLGWTPYDTYGHSSQRGGRGSYIDGGKHPIIVGGNSPRRTYTAPQTGLIQPAANRVRIVPRPDNTGKEYAILSFTIQQNGILKPDGETAGKILKQYGCDMIGMPINRQDTANYATRITYTKVAHIK